MITKEYDVKSLGVLRRYVEKLVYYEDVSIPAGLTLLPSPQCLVSINLTDRPSMCYGLSGKPVPAIAPLSIVVTLQTEPIVCGKIDQATAVYVYLKPYALRAIFGIRPVRNMILDLDEVFTDGAELRATLQEAMSSDRLDIVKQFLENKLHPLSEEALGRLEAVCAQFAAGECDLARVAARLGISKRSIHDLTVRYTALTPKTLSNIYTLARFNDCINKAERPIYWPTVVESLGMYDQSHLIKFFKKLTSMTPTQWYSSIEFTGYPSDEWIRPVNTPKG